MKQEIIGFVMVTLPFHWVHGWKSESAKEFCKQILDGEGIDYQEEDFRGNFNLNSTGDSKAVEVVQRYAKMYRDIYKTSDIEKANTMNKIAMSCNQILGFSQSMNNLFRDNFKKEERQKAITIKKGESITFSNGAGANLTPEELEHLMKATFSKEREEKPFTISFSASVSEECREEVMRRVASIFEEVNTQMKGKVK